MRGTVHGKCAETEISSKPGIKVAGRATHGRRIKASTHLGESRQSEAGHGAPSLSCAARRVCPPTPSLRCGRKAVHHFYRFSTRVRKDLPATAARCMQRRRLQPLSPQWNLRCHARRLLRTTVSPAGDDKEACRKALLRA